MVYPWAFPHHAVLFVLFFALAEVKYMTRLEAGACDDVLSFMVLAQKFAPPFFGHPQTPEIGKYFDDETGSHQIIMSKGIEKPPAGSQFFQTCTGNPHVCRVNPLASKKFERGATVRITTGWAHKIR
jgi:hypothetical protein